MNKDQLLRELHAAGGDDWSRDAILLINLSDKIREMATEMFRTPLDVHSRTSAHFVKSVTEMIVDDLGHTSIVGYEGILDQVIEDRGPSFFEEQSGVIFRRLKAEGKLDDITF